MVSRINFTRSRKMLITGFLLIVMFIAFILGSIIVKAQNNHNANRGQIKYSNIVVQDGQTLWDIAEEHIDNSQFDSIYEYMDSLKKLNGLTSNNIYSGQNIIITYYE
ncbi:MAG: LysM peptidoglycan-binding domain-containing protein [Butyrivibrio sp.]|nr:LysM peptidoglycan-binding domain-containing protein [Butyrivibrio sp.]